MKFVNQVFLLTVIVNKRKCALVVTINIVSSNIIYLTTLVFVSLVRNLPYCIMGNVLYKYILRDVFLIYLTKKGYVKNAKMVLEK